MNTPPEPLHLSTQERNALARVIEMAWDSIPCELQQCTPASKDMRSVWAASRALAKIKDHLKGK